MTDRAEASDFTQAVNDELLSYLPFEDRQDFQDAARGHIADLNGVAVKTSDGRVVWDPHKFSFIAQDAPAPPTVNPSLWRQSQLCANGGLFKVVDRLYQVRNHDISNLTIVEGDTGLIVFDPLISVECAGRAGVVFRAPAEEAGRRRGLFAQARRPLRGREGDHLRGRRCRGPGARDRAGGVPGGDGVGEHHGGQRDDPPGLVRVRVADPIRRQGQRRPGPRDGDLAGQHHADRAYRDDHRVRSEA